MKLLLGVLSALALFSWGNPLLAQNETPVQFSPAALNFPATLIGNTSAPLSVTLQPETIAPLHVRLGNPLNFEIVQDTCTTEPLQMGKSCTISITFFPEQFGHFSSSLVLFNAAGEILDFVPLEGLGVDGSFIPSATDSPMPTEILLSGQEIGFGSLELFASSGLESITVSNVGKDELHLKPVTIGGDDPAHFSVVETCSLGPIAPGSTCTIGAIFTPFEAGALQGALAINGNAEGSPFIIRLQGMGGAAPAPVASSGGCSFSQNASPAMSLVFLAALLSLLVPLLGRRLK